MEMKNYKRAQSLNEAYQLLSENPKNILIGGGIWLKMSNPSVNTLIDLSDLNLDQIEDLGSKIKVGAMVNLRDFEMHPSIQELGHGFLSHGVSQILGVGFRNVATIGGTIAGRYPFSDVITPLLTLKVKLIFYPTLEMSLEDYMNSKTKMNHILTHIVIEKENGKGFFKKVAKVSLEFATLNIAVFNVSKEIRIVVGARPTAPILAHEAMDFINNQNKINEEVINQTVKIMLEHTKFGSNYQASEAYRQELAKVYVKRGIKEVLSQ
ncbi:MAG: FAD binding domain-containing protein [Acholeplasmataceae bacterium]|nr:FAD binding domain-containing protein [Acholeplasmataceae bacterium]